MNNNPVIYRRVAAVVCAAISFAYLAGFIAALGPTLINDEYAAVDYIYRVFQTGHFFPAADRLNKPLSMVLGLSGILWESVIPFEIINALFAALLAYFLVIFISESLGLACALLAFILVFTNPDMLNYTATGSMTIPFAALAFPAARSVARMEQKPCAVWIYALCFFLSGLLRPEAWMFALPLVIYWWPLREKIGWPRIIGAIFLIELAPLIWFGRDYFINKNLFHSMDVAFMVKVVGSGAQFSVWDAFRSLPLRISNKLSWPTAIISVAGVVLFVKTRGIKSLIHPLIFFPALTVPYVWLISYTAHPVHRYFYFLSVFLLIFAAYFWLWLYRKFRQTKSWLRWLALLAVALLAAAHFTYLPLKFKKDLAELTQESRIQKDMLNAADYLRANIPEGQRPLIMAPSRRNEQLSWLFRDREIPRVVTFRKAYYLEHYKGYWFLNLEPDWILYIYGDYHFWGPQEMFKWLNYQDRTELGGVRIELVHSTVLTRIFKVIYPEDWREPPPVPSIP